MFLGIDLGTSSLKIVVINGQNELCASADCSLSVNSPRRNFSEQNPMDWIQTLKDAFSQLSQEINLFDIERIGLSGQMHGATLIDNKGEVLRPCILWNDGRSQIQCEELMSHGDAFLNASANLAMPGFTAPKLMWVKAHEQDIFNKVDKVLLPKDYLRFYLTGEFATDPSDASGTLWLNPSSRQWDQGLLEISGMKLEQMPTVFEGPDETGMVKTEIADLLGIKSIPVIAGGGDNACGALGMGVAHNQQSFISLGTSGVYFYVSDQQNACPEKTAHAFAHALPNTWHQMTVTLSAASCLGRLAKVSHQEVESLINQLSLSRKTETDVIFLPYLNGERSPHNDPDARGMFMNINSKTSDLDLCLAVLEGVAFSFNDGLDALQSAGASIKSSYAIGGGAKSRFWLQIMSDCLEVSINPLSHANMWASLGAARLALPNQKNAYPIPHLSAALKPDRTRKDYLANKLYKFRELYKATQHRFKINDQIR